MHSVTSPDPLITAPTETVPTQPTSFIDIDLMSDGEHPCVTEVLRLEQRLLDNFSPGDRTAHETLFALDFTYITPRGVPYDRDQTLALVAGNGGAAGSAASSTPHLHDHDCTPGAERTLSGLNGQMLGDDFVLLTYTTDCGTGPISRSSLWRKTLRSWQIVFHQGTINQADQLHQHKAQ